jgi:hypothetical protein
MAKDHGKSMLPQPPALIPYLLLVAALAGGLLCIQSEMGTAGWART